MPLGDIGMTSAAQPTEIQDSRRPTQSIAAAISAAGLAVSKPAPGDWSAWGELYSGALFATPFATSTYLRTLARAFRLNPSINLVSRGGEVIAGMALCGHSYLGANVAAGTPARQYSAFYS